MAVAFDVSINGMYLICDNDPHSRQTKSVILRKSFDNRISETIYTGTTGMSGIVSGLLLTSSSSCVACTTRGA